MTIKNYLLRELSRWLRRNMSTPYRAKKVGGSYQATGTVVSEFKTLAGKDRVVFEFDVPQGMLHIFSTDQIEREEIDDPRQFSNE